MKIEGLLSPMASDSDISNAPDMEDIPAVSPTTKAVISRKLRELYSVVQDEGIPDKFLDLLEKLDEAEKKSKASEI
jgi:hypothetical protein